MNEIDATFLDRLIDFRHQLHQQPEVALNEKETSNRIKEFAKEFDADELVENIGGYGFAIIFKGKEKGKNTAIRAEMDALPIQEKANKSYTSKNKGVAHLCGHDGHIVNVLSLLDFLSKNKVEKGNVILLFQAAEEIGEGAAAMIEDAKLKELKIDFIFGLHNVPQFEMGKVLLKDQHFCAASKGIKLFFEGKTAHAAEPQNGISPALAISELIIQLSDIQNGINLNEFGIGTIVHSKIGEEAFGISPSKGVLMMTLRSYLNEDVLKMQKRISQLCQEKANKYQLQFEMEETEVFPATINHPEGMEILKKAIDNSSLNYAYLNEPFKWSEDFGHFLNNYNGAFFGLGSGIHQANLHHENFDYPDDLIPIAHKIFQSIIHQINY